MVTKWSGLVNEVKLVLSTPGMFIGSSKGLLEGFEVDFGCQIELVLKGSSRVLPDDFCMLL